MVRGLVLLVALLAVASGARGQIAASAYADRTVLGEGEVLTFTLEVTGVSDLGTVSPPVPSRHLRLQSSTPSFQKRTTFGTQTRLTLGWRYQAIATGQAELGAMSFMVSGQRFSTDPISIDVTRGGATVPRQRPLAQPPPVPSGGGGGLFVRAVPRTKEAVVGEQIVVDYILYFDPARFSPRQAIAVGTWDAPGFWREELDVPTSETYPRPAGGGGRDLRAVTIRRLALFPARSGDLELAAMDFEVEIRETDTSDPFAPFFSPFRSRRVDREVTASAVTIGVDALPAGEPDTFGGAVGTYTMSARVTPLAAAPGDPVQLTVTLRGTGNGATLTAPEIEAPAQVDAYAPTSERSTDTARSPLVSIRQFTYTFVPQQGSFEIPEIAWTYFDPEAGQYRTLREGPFDVRVDGAPVAAASGARGAVEPASWQRTRGLSTTPLWGLLGVGVLLPAIAGLGLMGVRRQRQRPRRSAGPDAAARLTRAADRPPREQAAETERVLRETLATHFGPLALTMPRRDLVARASSLRDAEAAGALDRILARCEAARYAGDGDAGDLAADARVALKPFRSPR